MPVRNTLNNKLVAATLAVVIVSAVLWGCASINTFSFRNQYPSPLNAVSVVQNGLSLAVWLEDHCESQEADEQGVTLLEALHDGLGVPPQALFALGVITVVGIAWSLYDRITLSTGEPWPNRPQMVLEYVKPHRAGPQQRASRTYQGTDQKRIEWLGCLSALGDG